MLPTRKRQGTWDQGERKRLCTTSIAAEREHSGVVEDFAEGRVCFADSAEGPLLEDASPAQVGEATNSLNQRSILLLDIFSGTAGVTAAFIQLGGEALGLDHVVDKNRVKGPVSKVDLCKLQNQQTVMQWLDQGKVDAVMLAPPCGTSSRAREIPIMGKNGQKRPAPQPLRSSRWPDGRPSLRGLDAIKVRLANKLYAFTRKVIDKCCQLNIPFICENPQRSWMWETSFFKALPAICRFQCIHSCMYGGRRLKKTALLMNFNAQNLLLTCDNKHPHLPWGKTLHKGKSVFSTSTEAEYPWPLCKQLAFAFMMRLQQLNKAVEPATSGMDVSQRIGAGVQPRGKFSPLLVAEFKCKVLVTSSGVAVPREIATDVHAPFQGIPVSSKCISSRTEVVNGDNGEKKEVQISEFGVYRSPEEFLAFATTLIHPLDSPQAVDQSNLKAIISIRDWKKSEVVHFRAQALKRYLDLARAIAVDEQNFRASLDSQVNEVLGGKRLLLFKRMCIDAKVGDESLFEELTQGFRLTGTMNDSGKFPRKLKPAGITLEQLRKSSEWAKKMIHSSCRKVAADAEVAEAVFQETQQQLQDGWVKGPFSAQQLDSKFSGCWIPSKRFGVRQGGKIRAVDDFSEFLVNMSVTSTEKLALYGIDEVVNTARAFMCSSFLHVASDGSCAVDWNKDPSKGPWLSLKGRALDLKAAYKQLARHPCDAWASILAVWNPSKNLVEYYESVALPFGSVSAVMCFNRMARALRIIMAELFLVVNTNFFDDFCQIEVEDLCDSAWSTAEMVMKLLGWRISVSDEKRLPFADSFQMLGAVMDFSESSRGVISVRNKQSRLDDISALVHSIVEKDSAPFSLLETLKGRLLYASGHTFGKCTQLAIHLISKSVKGGRVANIDSQLRQVLLSALKTLMDARPRRVSSWTGRPPVLVFTDGACEEEGANVSHGAVLVDLYFNQFFYFGDSVPQEWTDKWKEGGKTQLIGQAEIFPVLVAKKTWKKNLEGRPVLWFLDNSSAQAALVRSFSPVLDNYELLTINAVIDVALQSLNWYSRVPSKSNPGDAPSRLEFAKLDDQGYVRCEPCYSLHEI